MKRETIVGIIAIVAIVIVAMVTGCGDKTSIPPNHTQPEKTEFAEPVPHLSSGTPSVRYVYHQGFMIGADVDVIVTNRGGPGYIAIIYEIIPWPSHTSSKETKRISVYLDANEERKESTFIPLPTGAQSLSINVTASPVQ